MFCTALLTTLCLVRDRPGGGRPRSLYDRPGAGTVDPVERARAETWEPARLDPAGHGKAGLALACGPGEPGRGGSGCDRWDGM